jgi:hypothetical protein
MPTSKHDPKTLKLWVRWPELVGRTLLGKKELRPWLDALLDGRGPGGEVVKGVEFVFSDVDAAEYNHDSLAFARIGVWLEGEPPTRFVPAGGGPRFEVREDGGI